MQIFDQIYSILAKFNQKSSELLKCYPIDEKKNKVNFVSEMQITDFYFYHASEFHNKIIYSS